ncbi:monofunctional biosynthetic peptidoglycan transglycosylase [Fodinibius sediminis]|uniref:Biosynthetic peptidoglycan transglycosylase n=1 Tax=Fodinibius sediminis TaxID=1214077 RepID=A0A521AI87_9BACT|nr:monofunctional biosynthetic peptidoglycan transglycosylase [Fodinibius sediminis]SMO34554.1 monofunctional biosynthetic peptidoglycan transglycosylase [Fodinibius sediminis]
MAKRFQRYRSKILRWTGRIAGTLVVTSLLAVLLLRWIPPISSSFMIQRALSAWWNGEENFDLHYSWTDWEGISPHLKIAAVTSEDQSFASHWGIDWSSVQKALDEYNRGGDLRGASTITQQTAKNLFLWSDQTYLRKGIEAYFALVIELFWSKKRILEVYLNIAEFGDGIYGVQAAAEHYFNTTPGNLSRSQSALMVTALPSPRRYNLAQPSGYMLQRRDWVLRYMDLLGNAHYLEKLD